MISFKTISSFRTRLAALLKVKRKVYANVEAEIKREFADNDLKSLLKEFIEEAQNDNLLEYAIEM